MIMTDIIKYVEIEPQSIGNCDV